MGWAGCGAHVEQVLAGVPKADRCRCREEAQAAPPAGGEAKGLRGFLGKLLGR